MFTVIKKDGTLQPYDDQKIIDATSSGKINGNNDRG